MSGDLIPPPPFSGEWVHEDLCSGASVSGGGERSEA